MLTVQPNLNQSTNQSFKALLLKGTSAEAKSLEERLIELCPKQLFDKPFVGTSRFLNNNNGLFIAATSPSEIRGINNTATDLIQKQRFAKPISLKKMCQEFLKSTKSFIDYSKQPQEISQILDASYKPGFDLSQFVRVA